MPEIKLKPCPFCGGENVLVFSGFNKIICRNCKAKFQTDTYMTDKELAEAWNKRAEPENVVHAHWNETFDYTGTCYAECSRCGLLWWIEEGTAEENEMFYCPKCGAKMDEVVSE